MVEQLRLMKLLEEDLQNESSPSEDAATDLNSENKAEGTSAFPALLLERTQREIRLLEGDLHALQG